MPKAKSFADLMTERDPTEYAVPDVVAPKVMRANMNQVVECRRTGKQTHGYGNYVVACKLFLEESMAVQAYVLKPEPEFGNWFVKIDRSVVRTFVKDLGTGNGSIKSFVGSAMACIFSQSTPDGTPELKQMSFCTMNTITMLNKNLHETPATLDNRVLEVPELSSIKTNTWF